MTEELWKPVRGFGGRYDVSNFGRLRKWTNQRGRKIDVPKLLNPYKKHKRNTRAKSYSRVTLQHEFGPKCILVHRLVAEAFLQNPDRKLEINHINGDTLDNGVWNLEWVTTKENRAHRSKFLSEKGKKLDPHKVKQIRQLIDSGEKQILIAKKFNISPSHVSHIKKADYWRYKECV